MVPFLQIPDVMNKYRGVLLGALLGDCIGLKYEGFPSGVPVSDIQTYFSSLHLKKPNSLPYSDDSAMTLSISKSLISCKKLDRLHLAKCFGTEFLNEPDRGYGPAAFGLLPKLASESLEDPWLDASKVFKGTGSYGNGAAMRTSPIALFARDVVETASMASDQAKITHSHFLGVDGAILQSVAIKIILDWDFSSSKPPFSAEAFLNKLLEVFEPIETPAPKKTRKGDVTKYYSGIIGAISKFIKEYGGEPLGAKEMHDIVSELGNEITAQRSVPLSLFIFLHTLNKDLTIPISRISREYGFCQGESETLPPFCNALMHAIAFGGDTDTIGSMCGALCGAYYGEDVIPKHWISACESSDQMIRDADALYQIHIERLKSDSAHQERTS